MAPEFRLASPDGKRDSSETVLANNQETDRIQEIQRRLLAWYSANRRQLPWRDSTDPYAILVSEFMLQQTGVDRVRPIFEAFLHRFPSFQALAEASRLDVLRAWAGLGYNRRAVHLHECARSVAREHGGVLPRDAPRLRDLPGVGPYTAAAILSFVYHDDVAAIDTNIRRVVGRLSFPDGCDEKELAREAAALVPPGASAAWNQAVMDFGSSQCTATKPQCLLCPLLDLCESGPIADSPPGERRVAERSEPYLGSRRYLRGRIVAYLRQLGPSELVPVTDVSRVAGLQTNPGGAGLVAELTRHLAADGLARCVDGPDGMFVGPPV